MRPSRFVAAGLLALVTDYATFSVAYGVLHADVGAATVAGFLVSLAVSFGLNKLWVFESRRDPVARSARQLLLYGLLLAVNIAFTYAFVAALRDSWDVDPRVGKVLAIVVVTTWNYVLYSKVVFPTGQAAQPSGRTRTIAAASLGAAFLLYLVGVPFVLLGMCLVIGVLVLPPVPVMGSVAGRLVLSVLLFFAVFQVAATVQFLVLPSSRFGVSAALTAGVYLTAVVLADLDAIPVRDRVAGLVNRYDGAAAIVVAVFLLPFTPIVVGDDAVARVAQIGGGTAIDATNHFAMIGRLMGQQHWSYGGADGYYPQGFHIVVAFVQDGLGIAQTSADWRQGVLVYIGQYLVSGALMAAAIGYCLSGLLLRLAGRGAPEGGGLLLHAAGTAAGAIAGPFLLWSFVTQGFLNYYYVIATVLVAFVLLLTGTQDRPFAGVSLYLVLVFGAGLSWPLLIPPLLATVVLVVGRKGCLGAVRAMPRRQVLGLVVAIGMQFVPLALQLHYDGSGGRINFTGGLRDFHPLSLLLSAAVLLVVATSSRLDRELRERCIALVLPLLAFVGLLSLVQFFLVGEVRYYAIKSAFLLESLNLVFLCCLVAVALLRLDLGAAGKFATAAVVPVAVVFSLLAVTANPLTDVRNLFRTEAGQVKPDFYDADLSTYVALGIAGDVGNFNTTLLHHDAGSDKYFAHMQISFWANMMRYDGETIRNDVHECNKDVYENLAFGTATDAEQRRLIARIKECARLTREDGEEYVIVTDPASESLIRDEFGAVARVVVHGGR
ncbi:GtrA family protein [Geodermatophilus sp. SYSU D00758]